MGERLSEQAYDVLLRIETLKRDHGACGMFPKGAGSWSTMRALVRRGLVKFYGWGRDIDGEEDDDVAIYDMTPAGEAALDAWKKRHPSTSPTIREGAAPPPERPSKEEP